MDRKKIDFEKMVRALMGDIRVELDDEFDKNFERQGFFTEAWKRRTGPLRPGGATLVDSGTLRRSFRSEIRDGALVFVYGAPYAAYHNEGATVRVTERMKMFFRHRYYELSGSASGGLRRGGKTAGNGGGTAGRGGDGGVRRRLSDGGERRRLSDGGFYALMERRGGSAEAKFWGYMSLKKVGSVIKIPQRRFLGTSPEVERMVKEVIEEGLEEFFEKGLT